MKQHTIVRCCFCEKVRADGADDDAKWVALNDYLGRHSRVGLVFAESYCPECFVKRQQQVHGKT